MEVNKVKFTKKKETNLDKIDNNIVKDIIKNIS